MNDVVAVRVYVTNHADHCLPGLPQVARSSLLEFPGMAYECSWVELTQ